MEDEQVQMANNEPPVIKISAEGLHPLQARPSFFQYCREIWDRRHFIVTDARFKALRTKKDYRLWRLWLILQPIMDVAFYGLLFGFILKTSRGIDNFVGFLIMGVIFMKIPVAMMTQGTLLIRTSRGMIQTFQFPRATLVFSNSVRHLIDNALPAIIAIVVSLLFQLNEPLHPQILLVFPLYLMIHIFGCGVMLFTARLTAEIPDTRVLFNFVGQAWFFLSGVMFSIDRFVDHQLLHRVMSINPGYQFLEAIRGSVLYGVSPSGSDWLTLLGWTFGAFIVGLVYFWQAEEKYVRLT